MIGKAASVKKLNKKHKQTNKQCSERLLLSTAQEYFKKLQESLDPSKHNVKQWEVGQDFCTVKYNTLI